MTLTTRLWCLAASVVVFWKSYRLFTNPFVACAEKNGYSVASDICASNGSTTAAVYFGLLGAALVGAALWPGKRQDPMGSPTVRKKSKARKRHKRQRAAARERREARKGRPEGM
ncbi:hypothetical protein [Lysobacter panacisoli]|uniref:Uncharacterized protein n=1 Tax=Lysobacter panacisoli TaxID=1255263 RepID=A0ABP9LCZ3_9GAMM|nr:hypothetical protein [Lysobacter panacisoli]